MWNGPTPEHLAKLPKLYETEKVPLKDKQVYIHFFIGDRDWFISEYDGERAVDALARAQGLSLDGDHAMPANNRTLVWRRNL